jgi:hypothetical protein
MMRCGVTDDGRIIAGSDRLFDVAVYGESAQIDSFMQSSVSLSDHPDFFHPETLQIVGVSKAHRTQSNY